MYPIKADHTRRLQLAGVPDPVARPVDIDQASTGFTLLRSLRIYSFDAGSVIDGHAETDEVLIVILAGSVRLTMSERDLDEASAPFRLSAVETLNDEPCAAYLPPNGAYKLVALTHAEVAYARATPSRGRAPAVFAAKPRPGDAGMILFEEATYPQHLRLRVVQVKATRDLRTLVPIEPSESRCEALVHVRTEPAHGAATLSGQGTEPTALASWDTVSVLPGERPALEIAEASSALLLVLLASP